MAYKDPENTLVIETTKGKVVIEMRPDLAPAHVEHIKKLAREGQYDGVVFHRVIDGFMAQTGDVKFGNAAKGETSRLSLQVPVRTSAPGAAAGAAPAGGGHDGHGHGDGHAGHKH